MWLVVAREGRAQRPTITGVTCEGGAVRLTWTVPTNRFIVEATPTLTDTHRWWCTGSSTGAYASTWIGQAQPWPCVFYRLQVGLEAVPFPDTNLERAVRETLPRKRTPTNCIYDVELRGILEFTAMSRGISNLTGLAALRDLRRLNLSYNRISDALPLTGLTNLTEAYFYDNAIRAIDFSGLPCLTVLNLGSNRLTDISFLAEGRGLTNLVLWLNSISNLTPLVGLTNLVRLDLSYNSLRDIRTLTNHTRLQWLDVSWNQLLELSPLLTNAMLGGLGTGDYVYVTGNPLSLDARTNHIPRLRTIYGVTVIGP